MGIARLWPEVAEPEEDRPWRLARLLGLRETDGHSLGDVVADLVTEADHP